MVPMGNNQAINAYSQVNTEAAVNTASPVQLIVMLYDGAIGAIASAKGAMSQSRFEEKGKLISKAMEIIEGLRAVLDQERGGEIAKNLNDLYEYMKKQLLLGNLRNRPEQLDEVMKLLSDLRGAWVTINTQKAAPVAQSQTQTAPPPTSRPGMSYGKV